MYIKFYNSCKTCNCMELNTPFAAGGTPSKVGTTVPSLSSEEIEYKPVVQDDGTVKLKKKSDIKRGKKSKSSGSQFELKVRKDLENKGWIVDKWSNNLDIEADKVVPCKRVFKRFAANKGVMTIGTGFPDFIAFQKMENQYKIIGVEVKISGKLSRIEKEKCSWYLKNEIFSEVLVAKKVKEKNRVRVEYIDFLEIEKRMR